MRWEGKSSHLYTGWEITPEKLEVVRAEWEGQRGRTMRRPCLHTKDLNYSEQNYWRVYIGGLSSRKKSLAFEWRPVDGIIDKR